METQITQAAKRFSAIYELLKTEGPLTPKQLYEKSHIRDLSKGYFSVADTLNSLHNRGHVRKLPAPNERSGVMMYEVINKDIIPKPPVAGSNKNKPVIKEKVNNISSDIMPLPEITVTRTGVIVQTDKFKLTIEL